MKRVAITIALLAASIEAVQLQSTARAGFFGSIMKAVAPAVQNVIPEASNVVSAVTDGGIAGAKEAAIE